ncbi:MAG: VWA domain-containing protein [Anaerolineae bacterium]|nr:VWA domain-containing protein [Anaerolineae bacterium]
MKARFLIAFISCFAWLGAVVLPVQADGIVVPEQPPAILCDPPPCPPDIYPRPVSQLTIRYHHVTANITNQLAVTHIDQVFYNPNPWPVEGTYIFPLPSDAALSDFRLWVDREPVQGKILDAEQARRTYEEIVSKLLDPALLEYIGQGAVQAKIYPIPPHGERRIELEYTQVLKSEEGLVRYVYPLNTEKFSQRPLESVRVSVALISDQPIRAAYSPSHQVAVEKKSNRQWAITYEASDITPDKDFALFFSLGEPQALHLLTYRDSGDESDADGFFLMLLAPSPSGKAPIVAKDVLLVLDRSGSMEGEKLAQAKEALRYVLERLNAEDRFYLLAFSSGIQAYAPVLRPVTEAHQAIEWLQQIHAEGSTDINRALLEAAAVAQPGRPTYLVFLTDGLPTEGEVESDKILANFSQAAGGNVRVFPFGVGFDVDTYLLDTLSAANHGLSTYVEPDEMLDEKLSAFYNRIHAPALTDLSLEFTGVEVYDIYPNPLPDLFFGNQIVLTGRYRTGGKADIILRGRVNQTENTFEYPQQWFVRNNAAEAGVLAEIPRLWATRKIGYLLNSIRLKGADEETVEQIVRLSVRYGIVTPYTSYLVSEPMPLGAENIQRLAQDAFAEMQSQTVAPSWGQAAVEKAQGEGTLSQAEAAPEVSFADGQEQVRTVGARSFVLQHGEWVDTRFDAARMKPLRVAFLSKEYFTLAAARPDIAAALAIGERVVVVVDGQAYQIVGQTEQTDALQLSDSPEMSEERPVESFTPTEIKAQTSVEHPSGHERQVNIGVSPLLVALVILLCAGGLIKALRFLSGSKG